MKAAPGVGTNRLPLNRLTLLFLGLLTAAALLFNPPDQRVPLGFAGILIAYSLLVALSVNFAVNVEGVRISPVHGVAIMLLLSLPREALSTELWLVALAVAGGELLYAFRVVPRPSVLQLAAGIVRVTLSFYVAALLYTGPLPLNDLDGTTVLPVLGVALAFTAIYILLFLFEYLLAGKPLESLRREAVEIALLLLIPLPFSVLGAVIYSQLSPLLFAIYVASLALIMVRLYEIARTQRLQVAAISSSAERELYEREKERVSQLATLNRVLPVLTDTLSPDTVLDTIISSASMLGESSAVAVYLYTNLYVNNDELELARAAGLSDEFQLVPPVPLLASKFLSGEPPSPLVVSDVNAEPAAAAVRPTMIHEGKAAWVELPLAFRGIRIGVLVIYYDAVREFSAETVELLRTFANQCSQAISNARQYTHVDQALERRVKQLLALANIGHHLTATLEVKPICELVAEYAQNSTVATAAVVVLLRRSGHIEQMAAAGFPEGALDGNERLLSTGVTERAIETKKSVMVGDVLKPENPGEHEGLLPRTRSQLTTPIVWNETVVGVIALESNTPNAFSEEDSYFVGQLANQAIIAIENARLFRRVSEALGRVQLILNTVREALILISTTGEIILANPRVEMLGIDPRMLVGRSLDGVLRTSTLGLSAQLGFRTGGEIQRLVKELRAPGGLSERETISFTLEADDQVTYIERQIFPVYDEKEQPLGVLLVYYDQTEEMRLAQTREEFSQMLVHDLRSPLTAVTTALKLLSDLTPKDSSLHPIVETTTDSSRRAIHKLLNRVDSLLDVSKMESGLEVETKPTELSTLVDNVCIELSPLAQELGITLKADIQAELPLLDIDADKVERVLLNLMDNALKFSPADSVVIVRSHEPGAEGAAPGYVRVDVVDAGPGVPDEYKLLLFDRFVQVRGRKGARRGTGLGLTFCRLVAETHGGRIWIDDNPTGGSIFSLTLPVALENALSNGTD